MVMPKQERHGDNHDDGNRKLRCIADKEVPPKVSEGPEATEKDLRSSTLPSTESSVGWWRTAACRFRSQAIDPRVTRKKTPTKAMIAVLPSQIQGLSWAYEKSVL
jgi:hypothetical protein